MLFYYEGFTYSSFKCMKMDKLIMGEKYLLIENNKYIKGTFIKHSQYNYLHYFKINNVVRAFSSDTWVLRVKKHKWQNEKRNDLIYNMFSIKNIL